MQEASADGCCCKGVLGAHAQLAGNLLKGGSVIGVHQAAQAHDAQLGIVWVGVQATVQLRNGASQHLQIAARRLVNVTDNMTFSVCICVGMRAFASVGDGGSERGRERESGERERVAITKQVVGDPANILLQHCVPFAHQAHEYLGHAWNASRQCCHWKLCCGSDGQMQWPATSS